MAHGTSPRTAFCCPTYKASTLRPCVIMVSWAAIPIVAAGPAASCFPQLILLPGMANRFRTLDQYHRIVLAHGIMAAIVFLLLVPVSVMMARFYSSRPGYAIAYHAQIHVFAGLMVLVVFILGFFAVGPERNLTNPHHG